MATTTKPKEFCAHCGVQVSTRGRAPKKLGVRYCTKSECRAAQAAALRAARPKSPVKEAPTVCAACKDADDPLPPRAWRAGDELGRYHRRPKCQRRRDEVRQQGVDLETADRLQTLETVVDILTSASAERRLRCPECGLVDAVQGWGHLNRGGKPCKGVLDQRGQGHALPWREWERIFAILNPDREFLDD